MSQDIFSLCRELLSLVKRIAPQECPLPGHKKQPTPDCVWCEAIAVVKKADQVIPTHAV